MKKKFSALITVFLLLASYGVANANPCAMKQGNSSNTNVQIDPELVTRPQGTQLFTEASRATLVKEGEQLFKDTSLGTKGMSCSTCHIGNANFKESFAKPYPHKVDMAVKATNVNSVSADEFVQYCIVVPLQGKPLAWEGRKLAALTAYVLDVKQVKYRESNN